MSYKQKSPLPIVEGGTGTELFEMAVGKQGFGVIVSGLFSTSPLEVLQDPGTAGQVLTSNGIGELPTFQAVGGNSSITQVTPDTGGAVLPVSGDVNLISGVVSQHSGSSVSFSGAGNTITFNVTDSNSNTIIGNASGNGSLTGTNNTALGLGCGVLLTDGIQNVMIGNSSGAQITTGGANTLLGILTGHNYTGNEHSNICIGYSTEGTTGETNTLRIGESTGSSPGQIAQTFIAGISGVNVGSVATVVTEASNQLGTAVLTAGSGISITPGANIITIAASGASSVTELTGDTGGAILPSSGNINIIAGHSSQHAGSSVSFSGSGNTLEFNVTDSNDNTIIGSGAGNGSIIGSFNTVLGTNSGTDLAAGTDNTCIGGTSGHNITSGDRNVLVGIGTGNAYTSSESDNILIGANVAGTIAESNVLRIGDATGSGASQIAKAFICGIDGVNVGSVATVVTEASNQLGTAVLTAGSGITITPGANTITIAASGGGGGASSFATDSGTATQSAGTINVIANVSALHCGSSVEFSGTGATVTLNVTDTNNNTIIGNGAGNASITGNHNIALGALAATSATMAGSGNIMLGDTNGSALTTGSNNILIGRSAGAAVANGTNNLCIGGSAGTSVTSGTQNILLGGSAGASLTGGGSNIYIGENAGSTSTTDNANLAIGVNAGSSLSGSTGNILIGNSAGVSATSGNHNTFVGLNAGNSISTGADSVIIGSNAGTGFTSSESSNVIINDNGTTAAATSNALVIGAGTGTGTFQLNKAFISGISGITVTGAAVLVSSSNQLGVAVSSRKFKHNIQDMYDASSDIYDLRPVTFVYNSDNSGKTQYGLIAEEVEAVFPDLIVKDKDDQPQTVQYHVLPILLLNEIKKLNARISALEARL